jgi:hypothetical protein
MEQMPGIPSARANTVYSLRAVFEAAGIEFIGSPEEGPGVRLGRAQRDGRLDRFARVVVPALDERLARAEYVDMRYTNGFAVAWRDAAAIGATGDRSNG